MRPRLRSELLVLGAGIAALGVTTGIVLSDPGRAIGTDAVEYLGLARNLAIGAAFSSYYHPGEPELYRTPAYPLLLSLTSAWRSMAGLRVLVLLQSLLALLTAYFIASAARGQGYRRPWILGGLYLLSPVALVYAVRVGTEALFVPLTCLAAALLVARGRDATVMRWGGSGLLAGASVLGRPIGLVLVALGVVCCAARLRRPDSRKRALAWALAALLLPSSWAIHNGVQSGYWGVSKTGPSFASSVLGETPLGSGNRGTKTSVYDDRGAAAAVSDVVAGMAKHPGAAIKILAVGAAKTLIGPGEWAMRRLFLADRGARDARNPEPWYEIDESPGSLGFRAHEAAPPGPRSFGVLALLCWSWLSLVAVGGIALAGAVHALRFRRRMGLIWTAAVALLLVASSGYQANARFRVPILPFALLLGACYRRETTTGTTEERGFP